MCVKSQGFFCDDYAIQVKASQDPPVRFQIKRSKRKRCDWLIIYVPILLPIAFSLCSQSVPFSKFEVWNVFFGAGSLGVRSLQIEAYRYFTKFTLEILQQNA